MIRTFIIEDEKNIQDELIMLLEKDPDIVIVGTCTSVKEALLILPKIKVELVLMDIQLDDGRSFEILEKLDEIPFDIIFITAYDEFAIKAIKIGALDYILKPVDPDELFGAVNLFKEKADRKISAEQRKLLLLHSEKNSPVQKITLRTAEQIFFDNTDQIRYCKGEGNYTTFYLENHKEIICSKTLKEYQNILPEENFVKTHQSYIVNKKSVDFYSHNHGVVLKDGVSIPVSVRRREEVLNLLSL